MYILFVTCAMFAFVLISEQKCKF